MGFLKETQLPLEVCPTSNICLRVFPSLEQHSLPKLIEYGLKVTINSDDPPMFNTTLTYEYLIASKQFGWGEVFIKRLVLNAVEVSLLPESGRLSMRESFLEGFSKLESHSS
jgi:adenosine deaminase